MRAILYTGKGGVGKTTISAATAVASAEHGYRTLVMSIDAAHSLGDSFEKKIGYEPTPLRKNLHALEIDVHHELERNWSVISGYIKRFLKSQGYDEVVAEELVVMPGMEELFSLLKLLEFERSGEYDVAIIDCAPTGSTLQFLGFSDVLDWYMTRFFNLERRFIKAVKPIAERIIKAPLPTDEVYTSVEGIYGRIMAIKELLTDPEKSSVRIVTNPEKMVVSESRRAYVALSLFGFPVDAVIANRLLPPEAATGYFASWKDIQAENMKRIDQFFSPMPILSCRLFDNEMVGEQKLLTLSKEIFGDSDPVKARVIDRPFLIETEDNTVLMKLKLPTVTKEDIDLWTKEDELIISVNGHKRNLLMPRALRGHKLSRAKFEGGMFIIRFEKES